MKRDAVVGTLLCALGFGCGSSDRLDRDTAAKLIKSSAAFSTNHQLFTFVQTGVILRDRRNPPACDEAALTTGPTAPQQGKQAIALARLRYITLTQTTEKQLAGFTERVCSVNLTDEGRKHITERGLLLAQREFIQVAQIAQEPVMGVITVDFDYRWLPTSAGAAVSDSWSDVDHGQAGFRRFDTGWKLELVQPRDVLKGLALNAPMVNSEALRNFRLP
jgi:hypothetical protein